MCEYPNSILVNSVECKRLIHFARLESLVRQAQAPGRRLALPDQFLQRTGEEVERGRMVALDLGSLDLGSGNQSTFKQESL